MFSAEDYTRTIAVLKAHSCSELAEGFVGFQEQAQKRENYARELGGVVLPSAPASTNGAFLLSKLLKDGWTPPKGLI